MKLLSTLLVLLSLALCAQGAQNSRIAGCPADAKSIDDCNLEEYLVRVLVFLLPGVIIGLSMLLCCCPCYFCARFCCGCCGGSTQSEGYCCAGPNPPRYTKFDIVRVKVYAIGLILFVLASAIFGAFGASQTVKGLTNFGVEVVNTPALLQARINDIDQQLTVSEYDPVTDTYSSKNLFGGSDLSNSTATIKNDMEKALEDNMDSYRLYVDRFSSLLFVVILVPVVFTLIGLLAALGNFRRCLPMLVCFFIFLFGFFLWTGHGVFSGVGMVLGDVCAELHGVVRQQQNVISALVPCPSEQFASFRDNFKTIEVAEAENGCNTLKAKCYDSSQDVITNVNAGTIYQCPNPLDCTGMTFGRLLTITETSFFVHPNVEASSETAAQEAACQTPSNRGQCTLHVCQTDCGTDSVRRSAKESVNKVEIAAQISRALDTVGAQYSSCDSIMAVLMGPFDSACRDVTDGMVDLRLSTGMEGIACLLIIVGMSFGAKRFLSLEEAYKLQMENGGSDDDE